MSKPSDLVQGTLDMLLLMAGEILFADTARAAAARKRNRQLGQAFERYFACYQA